jgi:hypothetical protein
MTTQLCRTAILIPVCAGALLLTGCAMFRAKVTDVNVNETRHLDNNYDYSDMRKLTEELVNDILAGDFVAKAGKPPILMIPGIENRTKEYVDTKSLTDRVRTLLIQSGKVQFVNEARREALLKEQGYQAANVTPETQVAVGKQIGAQYMVTGSFTQMQSDSIRQARVSKTDINYYKLTVEVTDLQTGLINWTTEKEFAREARTPLIGW